MNAFSPWFNGVQPPETDDVGFEIGDIVRLITGGPDFVVTDVCECGEVTVCWYDDNGIQFYGLPEEALVYAD
jgi:uncharacterized protein YodC (DUF2158 family)